MAESRIYNGNGHEITIRDPESISQHECVLLAKCGSAAWNNWRSEFPTFFENGFLRNTVDFSEYDFAPLSPNFEDFQFGAGASFTKTTFGFHETNFSRAVFGKNSSFELSKFRGWAIFQDTIFEGEVNFQGALFPFAALFENSSFLGDTKFGGALFLMECSFSGSRFSCSTNFSGTQFGLTSMFNGIVFSGDVSFEGYGWHYLKNLYKDQYEERKTKAEEFDLSPTTLSGLAFNGTLFQGTCSFYGRSFNRPVSFGANKYELIKPQSDQYSIHLRKFVERSHKILQNIRNNTVTEFRYAPIFHGCKLSEHFTFDADVKFPIPTGDIGSAYAYRTLKLAFAQQHAVREEQRFFKLEMEEEAARETGWLKWLYRAYRELSDFGFSIVRPVIFFLVSTALSAIIYGWQAGLVFDSANTHTAALVHFSLASAIPGLEKLAEPAALTLFGEVSKGIANYSLPTVLTLLAHKAVSLLALFLIGLALRNLFKMK